VEFLERAIEHLAERPDAPRLTGFKATLAWCELRAGRANVAREQLLALLPQANAGENDDHRMRVHYWLAEASLALRDTKAVATHLPRALALVRERGYRHFLEVQAREQPAPVLHALANGIEVDTCATALVEAGEAVEESVIEMTAKAPVAVAEAALAILGEVGGERPAARPPGP